MRAVDIQQWNGRTQNIICLGAYIRNAEAVLGNRMSHRLANYGFRIALIIDGSAAGISTWRYRSYLCASTFPFLGL